MYVSIYIPVLTSTAPGDYTMKNSTYMLSVFIFTNGCKEKKIKMLELSVDTYACVGWLDSNI